MKPVFLKSLNVLLATLGVVLHNDFISRKGGDRLRQTCTQAKSSCAQLRTAYVDYKTNQAYEKDLLNVAAQQPDEVFVPRRRKKY